jgi:uncharacterized protein DUF3309
MSVPFVRANEDSHQLIASRLTNLVPKHFFAKYFPAPEQRLALLRSNIRAAASVALGQQQIAAMLDRRLCDFGKPLQQPWQRHFQPDMIFRNVEMADRRLPERAHPKKHAIAIPSFFIDFQHRHALRGTRQPGLETAGCLLATEAVRNRDDKGFGHVCNPYLPRSCMFRVVGKKSTDNHYSKTEPSKFQSVLVRKAEQCVPAATAQERTMSIGTIILIILVIALLGGFSGIGGGPFYGTGYYGGGGLGLIVVILLILLLLGRL